MRKQIRITHGDTGKIGLPDFKKICDFLNEKDQFSDAHIVTRTTDDGRVYYGVVWNAPQWIWESLPRSYRTNIWGRLTIG